MHDIRMVREQAAALRDGMRRRGALEQLEPVIARLETLDRERRQAIQAVEEKKAARNAASQDVGRKKKAGEDTTALQAETRALGDEIARIEATLAETESAIQQGMYELPNVTLPQVPAGDETHNAVVRTWGTPRAADGVKPHWEVGEALGLL
ncbi:MAG: serine--tRNA ligase, partial [Gemmatimonadaceae bacterium]